MKVLIINGSPRNGSNTLVGIKEVEKILNQEGIETETINVGGMDIKGCLGCFYCKEHNKCVTDDIVNQTIEKFREADGILIGSPVYFASANGTLLTFLQRLFYSCTFDKTMKVGACVVAARRAGTVATFDEINRFFAVSGMPIASSTYWNGVFGRNPNEANEDTEGLQAMRNLGRNMAFLIKAIKLGKEKYGLPSVETDKRLNFIRK